LFNIVILISVEEGVLFPVKFPAKKNALSETKRFINRKQTGSKPEVKKM
jgi:hypothetical protein